MTKDATENDPPVFVGGPIQGFPVRIQWRRKDGIAFPHGDPLLLDQIRNQEIEIELEGIAFPSTA
jgi:hypothetical protein